MRAALTAAEGVTPMAAASDCLVPPIEIAVDGAAESQDPAPDMRPRVSADSRTRTGEVAVEDNASRERAAAGKLSPDARIEVDHGDVVDDESPLFMRSNPRRSFETSDRLASSRPGPTARQSAPPSTAALWASQLSQVAFPGRRSPAQESDTSSSTAHARSASVPGRPALTPLRIDGAPSTPPRHTTSRSDESPQLARTAPPPVRKRIFDSPSFRTALRLPFLPSIPASPLPIVSPGLTRSASSPPVIPAIPTTEPLNPDLCLTPPTASFTPLDRHWLPEAGRDQSEPWQYTPIFPSSRPIASASAPNLSLYATIDLAGGSDAYFTTPGITAASTPGLAPAGLSFSPIDKAPESFALDREEQGLTHDEALLILDATIDASMDRAEASPDAAATNRYHALLELVETERGYLEHLRVLVKVYFQTLPFLTILTLHEVDAIVRNAGQLLELHEQLGQRIEQVERELAWRDLDPTGRGADHAAITRTAAARIALIFVEQADGFSVYSHFCSRHTEAFDLVRSIAARPEWEAFERQCASRAGSDSEESTPIASRASSSIFFPVDHEAAFPSSPTTSDLSHGLASPLGQSSLPTASAGTRRSARLRFSDYAIAPIQRITRYPMLFNQLSKYLVGTEEHKDVLAACSTMKQAAQAVDAAKREREGEMRTRLVASRIEFDTPLVGGAFCDLLGPTLLVGALHVVHYNAAATGSSSRSVLRDVSAYPAVPTATPGVGPSEPVRVKYYGCFLYRSHLVMAKIKKRATYEPREWLPLRLFEIQDVAEGQGLLSHAISITFRDHRFELGALCEGEKKVWLSRLYHAQAAAKATWDEQDRDELGRGTLFDDSLVSSIPILSPKEQKSRAHSRAASSVSVASLSLLAPPPATDGPRLSHDEPVPPFLREHDSTYAGSDFSSASAPSSQPASPPGSSALALVSSPQLHSRSRFSATASSLLLGKTPASQRTAVDLRLADVFSVECQAARAQAAREAELEVTAAILAGKRSRTMSGPKRSSTMLSPTTAGLDVGATLSSRVHAVGGGMREGRRMSAAEMSGGDDRSDFDSIAGLELSFLKEAAGAGNGLELLGMSHPGALERERSHKWSNAIRKVQRAGSSSGPVLVPIKPRPPLPDIDTSLAQAVSRSSSKRSHAPLSAGGSWSRRGQKDRDRHGGLGGQLRRVASQSSIDADANVPRLLRSSPSTGVIALPSIPTPAVPADADAAVGSSTSAASHSSPARKVTATAAEVERNNSVSSTSSSSADGQSSSSHTHNSHSHETPPSSIPPSPNLAKADLVEVYGPGKPTSATWSKLPTQSLSQRPRWSSAVSGSVSNVLRLTRRKSALGLVPPETMRSSPSASSEESLSARSPTHAADHPMPDSQAAPKLQRRASATISSLFSIKRRNHSSPALSAGSDEPSAASVYSLERRSEIDRQCKDASVSADVIKPSPTVVTLDPQVSPQKRMNRAGGLIRSRSRALFSAHSSMTPLS